MREYQPNDTAPSSGLMLMLAAVVLIGVIVGGLAFLATQVHLYIVIFASAVMGTLGGLMLMAVVRQGKVRHLPTVIVFGLLTGTAIFFANHFYQYNFTFRSTFAEEYLSIYPDAAQAEVDEVINQALEDETGLSGFVGYLKYAVKQGVTISNIFQSQDHLNEFWTLVYLGSDWLIIAILCVVIPSAFARKSFDEEAIRRYENRKRFGSVSWDARNLFMESLKAGDFAGAAQMMGKEAIAAPRLDVLISEEKSSNSLLFVESCVYTNNVSTRKIEMRGILSAKELALLRENMPE